MKDQTEDEEITTGWSVQGNLRVNSPKKFLSMSKVFPAPDNYLVQFNLNPPTNPGGAGRAAARALVSWRVKGNDINRLISVCDGTAISGAAEAVNVRLYDDTGAGFFATNPDYPATITVAKGTRGANKQPPYLTLRTVLVAPGGLATVDIPSDIGANSIFVVAGVGAVTMTPVTPGAILALVNGSVGVATSWDPREHDWVPLDPGALNVQFRVHAGAGSSVRFTTYLGIEG